MAFCDSVPSRNEIEIVAPFSHLLSLTRAALVSPLVGIGAANQAKHHFSPLSAIRISPVTGHLRGSAGEEIIVLRASAALQRETRTIPIVFVEDRIDRLNACQRFLSTGKRLKK